MVELAVHRWSWRSWPAVAATWQRIHDACPDASFFLTREWVDCWLATFGAELDPELLTFESRDEVVGCCLMVWRTEWVSGIPVRRGYLNCAGEDEHESTCIEYNSLLVLPEHAAHATAALARLLGRRYWDELVLSGVVEHTPVARLTPSFATQQIAGKDTHYVDLARLRRDGTQFDAALSANTRHQIRRSIRSYEKASGSCTLRVAKTRDEATAMFTGLAQLHQTAWTARGLPGVFASRRFSDFHHSLIATLFDAGRIQLVEVSAGSEVIGALYNFLYRGRVYFYQSGLRYTEDRHQKPGMVTHYLAIRHCLERTDFGEYDFLAGDAQYKASLATARRTLQWIVVSRPTVSTLVIRGLRRAKRTYVRLVEKSRARNRRTDRADGRGDGPAPEVEIG